MTPAGEEPTMSHDAIIAASLRAQIETARALANGTELPEVMPKVLQSFCGNLLWDVGAFWTVEQEVILCAAFHGPAEMESFREITFKKRLRRGEGFPGRVWESADAITQDLLDPGLSFPRKEAALNCGLRFALALPVKVRG